MSSSAPTNDPASAWTIGPLRLLRPPLWRALVARILTQPSPLFCFCRRKTGYRIIRHCLEGVSDPVAVEVGRRDGWTARLDLSLSACPLPPPNDDDDGD